eukprot:scaffold2147_cov239-Alexandrium_tamarense.AAC.2
MMLSSRFLLELFLQDEITSLHHPGSCTHAQAQRILHPNRSPSKRCSSSKHEWNKSMFNDIHVHIQVNG